MDLWWGLRGYTLDTFITPLLPTDRPKPCMGMGRNASHVLPLADWGPVLVHTSFSMPPESLLKRNISFYLSNPWTEFSCHSYCNCSEAHNKMWGFFLTLTYIYLKWNKNPWEINMAGTKTLTLIKRKKQTEGNYISGCWKGLKNEFKDDKVQMPWQQATSHFFFS